MTLRSENKRQFWSRMTIVILFCLFVHATIVAETGGGGTFKFWRYDRMRIFLIEAIVIGVAAYELRVKGGKAEEHPAAAVEEPPVEPQSVEPPAVEQQPVEPPPVAPPPVEPPPVASSIPVPPPPVFSGRAEEAWQEARQIKHSFIPNTDTDYAYLRLLNESARLGHAEARFKLGEYALRRAAFVEAYYWLKMAKASGQGKGVDEALGCCLREWRLAGFDPQYENVTESFSERQGSLGRAALRLDSGVEATRARERLRQMVLSGDHEAEEILKIFQNTHLRK